MELNFIRDTASDMTENFDHIDTDNNGRLNLLELQKYAANTKLSKAETALVTTHHLDILRLEKDEDDHSGISRRDLDTLKVCMSDSEIAKQKRSIGLFTAGGGGVFGAMSGVGYLYATFSPLVWPIVPAALIGGAAGYKIASDKIGDMYTEKRDEVLSWSAKRPL